jgi:hypothetical protein
VVAVAGAWVTVVVVAGEVVVVACEVVAVDVPEVVALLAVLAALAVVAVVAVAPGIVIAPMAAKRAVATVAVAAEPIVRRRPSRSPASRLSGVGVVSVLFMSLRMPGLAPVFLRNGLESAVKIGAPGGAG